MPYQSVGGQSTLPVQLGVSVSGLVVEIGTSWSAALNGQGYIMSTLDQESPFEYRAYTVQSIPLTKPRIDMSEEPGEQTLESWWARSQHSWHLGAGQAVLDSAFSDRFKFENSKGVDIWTDSNLSLLKDTVAIDSGLVDDFHLVSNGVNLFLSKNGSVYKVTDIDTYPTGMDSSNVGGPGTDISGMVSDGKYLYVFFPPADVSGIRKIEMEQDWSGTPTTSLVNDMEPDLIAFAKNRLMAAAGPSLYELDLTVTTAPAAIFTHLTDSWVWTAITEGGAAIYCSGYAGENSSIYAIGFDTSTIASGAVLNAPINIWQAPEGEIVHTIEGYLGTSVLIGTSRGLRIGVKATEAGLLDVSPLLVETDSPVKAIEPQGDYAYFSWNNIDGVSTGLGRIHLGNLAYASDLMYDTQGQVTEIVEHLGRFLFIIDRDGSSTTDVIADHATNLVTEGSLTSGEIRYGTFETKTIRYFDALTVGSGKMDLSIRSDQSTFIPVFNNLFGQITEPVSKTGTRFNLKFTLHRDTGDATQGPTLLEWRTRAEPIIIGRFRYFLPVMLYDYLTLLNETKVGYEGMAVTRLNELMSLYRNGTTFLFQSPTSKMAEGLSPVMVKIEDLQFKEYAPVTKGRGFGGIALITMREQA